MAIGQRLRPPSAQHLLGTDEFGRDLLARVIHGSRISLRVGLISVAIGGLVGTALGLAAGLGGRKVDLAISGLVDVMLAFPGFLLALAIVATLGPSLENAMIAIGIRCVPVFVRVVRAGVLQLRTSEFVLAARALGAAPLRVSTRHVLRNVAPTLIVLATLQFPEALLVSAGLSFLGLGAQPPLPEWGALLTSARVYLTRAPWLVNFPGLAILVTVLGLNLLGNALRPAAEVTATDQRIPPPAADDLVVGRFGARLPERRDGRSLAARRRDGLQRLGSRPSALSARARPARPRDASEIRACPEFPRDSRVG
jgi:peptide/nickel transport system permease protein